MSDHDEAAVDEPADRLRAAGCVYADEEAELLVAEATRRGLDPAGLDSLVARRVAGEPLELVLGWAAVGGTRVAVRRGVFVPRRRSEALVAAALASIPDRPDPSIADRPVVVDLGCGSGALGRCVLASRPDVELHASDVDPAATELAAANLAGVGGVPAEVHTGDLLAPLPGRLRGRVAVMMANLPYVPSAARDLLPAEARDHEPAIALDGGADGLAHARRLLPLVADWLGPDGVVIVEHAPDQSASILSIARRSGLTARVDRDDDLGVALLIAAPGTQPPIGYGPPSPAPDIPTGGTR